MPRPIDAAPEVRDQGADSAADFTMRAPGDNEAAALVQEQPVSLAPAADGRDHEALASVAEVRVQLGRADTVARATAPTTDTSADIVLIPRQRGPAETGDALDKGDQDTEAIEVAGHIDGSGPDREISADLRYQYGHVAVALADRLTRAIITEDAEDEAAARAELDTELAAHRKDFAEWEAGLKEPESDAYFEASGITLNFIISDRPNLPATLVHVPTSGDDQHPAVMHGSLKPDTPDEPYQPLFTWLQNISDERLINYLQWSEARTDEVTEALMARREEIEQNVRSDFGRLIADGLAPEGAQNGLEAGFAYTERFGALSTFESGFYQAAAFYAADARRLGVHREYPANEGDKYVRDNHWVYFHEEMHAYDAANNTGLTYLLDKNEEPLTWVDEAVKQHLTEAATNGQPDVLNPSDRYTEGVYKDIRELLHLVLTGGEIAIDLRELTAANFEPHDSEAPCQKRAELASRLRDSYEEIFPDLLPGENILHVISREINAAPKPRQAQVTQKWIDTMMEWRDEASESDMAYAYR